jgi:hypothetical protein
MTTTTNGRTSLRLRRTLAAVLALSAYGWANGVPSLAADNVPQETTIAIHDDARIVENLASLPVCVNGEEIAPCVGPDYIVLDDGMRAGEASVIVVFNDGTVDFYPGR